MVNPFKLPDGSLVVNLTTHPVKVMDHDSGENIVIPQDELAPARIDMDVVYEQGRGYIAHTHWGEVSNLPDPARVDGERVYFIVSSIVKNALPDRLDLVVPSRVNRAPSGAIISCGAFTT